MDAMDIVCYDPKGDVTLIILQCACGRYRVVSGQRNLLAAGPASFEEVGQCLPATMTAIVGLAAKKASKRVSYVADVGYPASVVTCISVAIYSTFHNVFGDYIKRMKEISLDVVVNNLTPALWYASVGLAGWIVFLIIVGACKAILYAINPSFFPHITKSCLYYGRVKHTRLKGGAVHHLDYPIFFSYLDLDEMRTIGWYFWPIFAVNKPHITFCSFDFKHHLKDVRAKTGKNVDLLRLVQEFVSTKSNGQLDKKYDQVQILTHLTYFGYCFNPISIYYLKSSTSPDKTAGVIAEVSNTPWIEMHSYLLGEGFHGVESYKYIEPGAGEAGRVEAVWKKEFHVSPFMEMDYKYSFNFYEPGDKVVVTSKMIKESTKDVWFTANFELQRMPFTPLNLLYVLVFYPLQTRLIQVYIHYEAILLFCKGVPTFEHPNGTDVDFGFGITGERLGKVLWVFIAPFYFLASLFSSKTTAEAKKTR